MTDRLPRPASPAPDVSTPPTTASRHRAFSVGLAGLLAWHALGAGSAWAADPQPAPPMVIHQGDRLVVPTDSPLRGRLLVAAAGTAADPHAVSVPAVVEADPARTVNLVPPVTGRLLELRVGLGDAVTRGQVLAVIASPDLAQAGADAEKARDATALARQALDRARGVKEAGANATKDLEAAESNLVQATAEDTRAGSRLRILAGAGEVDPRSRNLALKAPMAGTVVALNAGRGAFLNDATAALLTLSNTDRVWVTAQVPENLLGSVERGQSAEVRLNAYPDQMLAGKVRSVSPLLEPDTRRTKVRIEFPNADGRLKPNMFATVRFAVADRGSVTVPNSALLMNNDDTTVLVEVAPWTFTRRRVELGPEDGERVRLLSGLLPGERIVVRGGILLND